MRHFPKKNTKPFKKTIVLFPVLSSMKGPRSRVPVPDLARNLFEHLRKRMTLKGPLFQFFRHCANFFSKILFPSKGPFIFFDILQQTGFSTSPKGPPFYNFKNLRFLSLRYSAEFGRSRLVFSIFSSGHRPHP